jgi:hypothetical protein
MIAASPAEAAPAIAHAAWLHGAGIQVEFITRIRTILRRGFHTHIEQVGSDNWFHFPIPTPVIVSDRRLQISSVILVFGTAGSGVKVTNVHVRDGTSLISAHDQLGLFGSHPFERFSVPTQPQVFLGIDIAVRVEFPNSTNSTINWVEFVSGGADFA